MIGLTGGIAVGKTLVAEILADLGAVVIDLDELGHEVYKPGEEAYNEVIAAFGTEILKNGSNLIDRRKLGKIVFNNPDKLQLLNSIAHPKIYDKTVEAIKNQKNKNSESVIVLDGALLIEMGMKELVDAVWVVAAHKEDQIIRLEKRDGLSGEEAEKRISVQMSVEEKILLADKVIYNTGRIEEVKQQVIRLWTEINS